MGNRCAICTESCYSPTKKGVNRSIIFYPVYKPEKDVFIKHRVGREFQDTVSVIISSRQMAKAALGFLSLVLLLFATLRHSNR